MNNPGTYRHYCKNGGTISYDRWKTACDHLSQSLHVGVSAITPSMIDTWDRLANVGGDALCEV